MYPTLLVRSTLLTLALLAGHAAAAAVCATPAKDGDKTAIAGVQNTYYAMTGTLTAGTTTLTLGTMRTDGATTAVAAGDLLLIMQMQGAVINSNNTSAYGSNGTSGQGQTSATAGTYEFATVKSVTGANVAVITGLSNTYTDSDATATQGQARYQVIRVPQYGNLTFTANGTVSAAPWNGNSGGVVALDATGNLNWNGATVDLTGGGFRGGGGQALGGDSSGTYNGNTDYRTPSTVNINGNKAEGIAGTPQYLYDPKQSTTALTVGTLDGYPNGSRGRGAPGNAGGGGNDTSPSNNSQNSGGGGGGNGGSGGQGGNAWSSNAAVGGIGGAATPYTTGSASRLFLGGGGGSGTRNNGSGVQSSGGAGGGIVLIRAGSSSGTGTVNVSGVTGIPADNDGGGGGGAGGTIALMVDSGTLSGVTLNANGAAGTNAWASQAGAGNAHGPGGGGGGGLIYTNVSGASSSATAGTNGTTTSGALPFGAQGGAVGQTGPSPLASIGGTREGAACPALTITKTTSTPTVWRGANATYTITVSNTGGVATGVRVQDTLPTGLSLVTASPTVAFTSTNNTAIRTASNDANTAAALDMKTFQLGYKDSLAITFNATTPTDTSYKGTTFQNGASVSATDGSGSTISASYNSASSTGEDVSLLFPSLTLVKTVQNLSVTGSTAGNSASGLPKQILEYCINYTNTGDGDLSGVVLSDSIPANSTAYLDGYSSGKGIKLTQKVTPPTNPDTYTTTLYTSASGDDSGSLSQSAGMSLALGKVARGASGTVCFQTRIN